MSFYPGFNIEYDTKKMSYKYPLGVFGPKPENRYLDDIRQSLMDPESDGPDIVYSIAMDVGRVQDKEDLINRNLLFGSVIYAKGQIGSEPIRSQGHIHAISKSVNSSTPEVYEIWQGTAYIYMQETAKDDCGRCFAVRGEVGDIIIVPPHWAHATISANPLVPLVFGAWCVRDYGFDYKDVRAHGGLAYFPTVKDDKTIKWSENPMYHQPDLIIKRPRLYTEFDIEQNISIYEQYISNRAKFDFVTNPNKVETLWKNFTP